VIPERLAMTLIESETCLMQNRGGQQRTTNKAPVWSIGIFSGPKLNGLKPASEMPVLSAEQVTDIPAEFVADPFMINVNSAWYMFFEVMNAQTGRGEIGLAKSVNGTRWDYEQIVLSEPFHLSYPHVFCADSEYFMLPESYEANSTRLYRAVSFPTKWEPVKNILEGEWVDSSVFFFDGLWWLLSNPLMPPNRILKLFYATSIVGPWRHHPMSPLISGNNRIARGAGRVIVVDNRPIRFAQDCFPFYGTSVRAFQITALTTSTYAEHEIEGSPILGPGQQSWNQSGMHHIDAHLTGNGWFACVDGWRHEGL
jgi:hypothetical protein